MTYAETLRQAMRAKSLNRRGLQRLVGYSYEHIRKITAGLPLMSRGFNEDVCEALGLNQEEMWKLALREKGKYRGEARWASVLEDRLVETVRDLSTADQEKVLKFAEALRVISRA